MAYHNEAQNQQAFCKGQSAYFGETVAVFFDTEQAMSIGNIPNLQPLTGYPNYYRIRFDYRYRIGVCYDGDVVEFLRVGTREDFYSKFP